MNKQVTYQDNRGWLFRVQEGLGNMFKARYKKKGKLRWSCVQVLPWRETWDEAAEDLAAYAEKKGMGIIKIEMVEGYDGY